MRRGLLTATAALLCADAAAGLLYRTGTVARTHVTEPRTAAPPRQAVVVFPGHVMPGGLLSRAFAPHLGPGDAMTVVAYAQRGVDMDQIYRLVMADLARLGPAAVRVYGASMGGMCAREFLARYARDGAPFGKVVLILDTSPSSPATVKVANRLLTFARRYRGGPLTSAAWALTSLLQGRPPADDGADPQTVARFHRTEAWTGLPAVTSQAAFIGRFPPLVPDELVATVERAVYLHGRPPGADPLIHVESAIAGWRVAFPALAQLTLTDRLAPWHIPLIERPLEPVRELLRY